MCVCVCVSERERKFQNKYNDLLQRSFKVNCKKKHYLKALFEYVYVLTASIYVYIYTLCFSLKDKDIIVSFYPHLSPAQKQCV